MELRLVSKRKRQRRVCVRVHVQTDADSDADAFFLSFIPASSSFFLPLVCAAGGYSDPSVTPGGIWVSHDCGRSFSIPATAARGAYMSLEIDPPASNVSSSSQSLQQLVALRLSTYNAGSGAFPSPLLVSTDGGATFATAEPTGGFNFNPSCPPAYYPSILNARGSFSNVNGVSTFYAAFYFSNSTSQCYSLWRSSNLSQPSAWTDVTAGVPLSGSPLQLGNQGQTNLA